VPRFQIALKVQKGREPHSREVVSALRRSGHWEEQTTSPTPTSPGRDSGGGGGAGGGGNGGSGDGAVYLMSDTVGSTGLFNIANGGNGNRGGRGGRSSSTTQNVALETKPFRNVHQRHPHASSSAPSPTMLTLDTPRAASAEDATVRSGGAVGSASARSGERGTVMGGSWRTGAGESDADPSPPRWDAAMPTAVNGGAVHV
jgi:hypothetical protein